MNEGGKSEELKFREQLLLLAFVHYYQTITAVVHSGRFWVCWDITVCNRMGFLNTSCSSFSSQAGLCSSWTTCFEANEFFDQT